MAAEADEIVWDFSGNSAIMRHISTPAAPAATMDPLPPSAPHCSQGL